MIKVVSFKICPFVQRVIASLEAKDILYEVEYISLKSKPDWFLKISPNGQVPVLITENQTPLFESDAIVEYIEEIYPPLEPSMSPEKRALNRAWSYLGVKNYLVQCSAQRSRDQETLTERSEKLSRAFSRIEETLRGTRFFNGNHLGMVDIAWLPLIHRAWIIEKHSGYDFLKDFPKIKKWQQELMRTALHEKSVAEDFEEAFANFYLSEETYLGRNLQ